MVRKFCFKNATKHFWNCPMRVADMNDPSGEFSKKSTKSTTERMSLENISNSRPKLVLPFDKGFRTF